MSSHSRNNKKIVISLLKEINKLLEMMDQEENIKLIDEVIDNLNENKKHTE